MKDKTPRSTSSEDAILDAAATVFAEKGYAGARIEAIAQAAAINKAMLYYRVGDKARLYELTLLQQFGNLACAIEGAVRAEGDAQHKLRSILQAVAARFADDPRLPRLMAWELASQGANLPPVLLSMWSRIIEPVAALAKQTGRDPALLYFSLIGPLVFTCLTEPVRQRFAGEFPVPLRRFGEISVKDMSDFLGDLLLSSVGEAS